MSFKIESTTYKVNHQDHTLTIKWTEREPGMETVKRGTFPWHPEKVYFRLFVGNDPMIFAKDFIKGEQFKLDCKSLHFLLRNRVVSVLSGIKSAITNNVSALFSMAQKAFPSCHKRTPVANPEKAENPLDHADIHFVSDELEIAASDVEEEPLTSKIDRLNAPITEIIRKNCKTLRKIQHIKCDYPLFQHQALLEKVKNDSFVARNKAFAPLEYVRKLEAIRNGLEKLIDNRSKNMKGELAEFVSQLEMSLEPLNKLIEVLKN